MISLGSILRCISTLSLLVISQLSAQHLGPSSETSFEGRLTYACFLIRVDELTGPQDTVRVGTTEILIAWPKTKAKAEVEIRKEPTPTKARIDLLGGPERGFTIYHAKREIASYPYSFLSKNYPDSLRNQVQATEIGDSVVLDIPVARYRITLPDRRSSDRVESILLLDESIDVEPARIIWFGAQLYPVLPKHLRGIPVSYSIINQNSRYVIELRGIERVRIAESEFELPKGYSLIQR